MNMTKFAFIEQDRAVLYADMNGTNGHEEINGGMFVFNLPEGIYFALELSGLPENQALPFHVHEGTLCENSGEKAISSPMSIRTAEETRRCSSTLTKLAFRISRARLLCCTRKLTVTSRKSPAEC